MQNGKKTALICGMAKSGIASAILLYKNGYKVIINDMKSEISGLQEALKDIEYVNAMGQTAWICWCSARLYLYSSLL